MALTEEKKARLQEQMNELKEGIAAARGKMQADAEKQYEEFRKSLEEAAERAEAENKKAVARMEKELEELSKDPEIAAKMEAAVNDENNAEIMGDLEAAKENMRLAQEYNEGKWNTALLKAQMNVNAIKARRAEQFEAMDKADRSEYISYLLDYADDCEVMAESFLLEAELAVKEALREIDDYEKEYGEKFDSVR